MKSINKKPVIIGVIMLLITGAVVWRVLDQRTDLGAFVKLVRGSDVKCFVIAGLAMMVFILLSGINIGRALKVYGIRPGLGRLLGYSMTGFFFSSITPSASGGQPAQLMFMKRDGICIAKGSFAMLLELLSYETGSILWGLAGFIVMADSGMQPESGGYIWLFAVGFGINLAGFLILILILYVQGTCRALAGILVWTDVRLFRGKGKNRILKNLVEYKRGARVLKKNPGILIRMLPVSLLQLGTLNSIPYFCAAALGGQPFGLGEFTSLWGMLYVSVSSLPMPGAAGVTEGGGAFLFGGILSEELLTGMIITSRVISFVIPLIVCGLGTLVFWLRKPKKQIEGALRK